MHKEIKEHKLNMERRIGAVTGTEAKELLRYHQSRVQDFQHERLAHLLVTLFFGGLVVCAVVGLFMLQGTADTMVVYLLDGAIALLLLTELFYVGHYYQLENGVQSLYFVTKKLHERSLLR